MRCLVDGVLTPGQEVKSGKLALDAFGCRKTPLYKSLDTQITRKSHHSQVRVEA
jgi:hypothetical protein